MVLQRGIYQHYKGQIYQVFNVARHSETEEQLCCISVFIMVIIQCGCVHYQCLLKQLNLKMGKLFHVLN